MAFVPTIQTEYQMDNNIGAGFQNNGFRETIYILVIRIVDMAKKKWITNLLSIKGNVYNHTKTNVFKNSSTLACPKSWSRPEANK